MEHITPDQETRASQWETRWANPHGTYLTQGGAPAHPDEPEEPGDEDDDAGYPGITRPEMPATDRESVERPEKAPNPLNEPDA